MIPVDQEFTHKPEIGQHGDCMRAVIASLLELPISDVPHFAQIDAEGGENFWLQITEFCRSRGYVFATFRGDFVWSDDEIFHGITGPSPRGPGLYHVVVGRNGRIVHDPHPSRAGLAGDPSEWKFELLLKP